MDKLVAGTGKKAGFVFSLILMLAASICLIVDYSVNRSLHWSLFPLAALFLLWVILAPILLLRENKAQVSYAGFVIVILPFLYVIQWLVPQKDWFVPLAFPIALIVIIAFGLILIVFKFFNNKIIAVAVALFLLGVLVNYSVDRVISQFLGEQARNNEPGKWVMWISAFMACALLVFGYFKKNSGAER